MADVTASASTEQRSPPDSAGGALASIEGEGRARFLRLARSRLLAAFVAANLVGFVLVPGYAIGLWGRPSEGWIKHLDLRVEGWLANTYQGGLLAAIAVLAVAQLCFSPRGGGGGGGSAG